MNDWLAWAVILPVAYLIGSIPVGIIVCKLFGGADPRQLGSGSMGATNVLRTVGKKAAALVLALDFAKGVVVIGMSLLFASDAHLLQALAGSFVIVGHTWPVFAGFKGGKGIATGWGAILVLSPVSAAATLIGLAIALLTKYVSLGSIIGTTLGVVVLILLAVVEVPFEIADAPLEYLAFAIPAVAMILFSHRENMTRLRRGTENRLDINAAEGESAPGGPGA